MHRILIVDDEPLIAAMLVDWVQELGCVAVGPATSQGEAHILIQQESPDAAILDVSLGSGDSFALATACREKSVPFAFATGHGRSALPAEFADAPVLGKPFDFQAVKELIEQLTT